jgi:hypothetical protein
MSKVPLGMMEWDWVRFTEYDFFVPLLNSERSSTCRRVLLAGLSEMNDSSMEVVLDVEFLDTTPVKLLHSTLTNPDREAVMAEIMSPIVDWMLIG